VEYAPIYQQAGATVTDQRDMGVMVVTGGDTVDTNADLGTSFIITYNATDDTGSTALEVTIVVTILAMAVEGEVLGGCNAKSLLSVQVDRYLGEVL
tara:strand:+ start:1816 stop:2103 length:288 start_codon:yes stop_codon:yes gene_type:complete